MRFRTPNNLAFTIHNDKFNSLSRRACPCHCSRQSIDLGECFDRGGVLRDDGGVPHFVATVRLNNSVWSARFIESHETLGTLNIAATDQ